MLDELYRKVDIRGNSLTEAITILLLPEQKFRIAHASAHFTPEILNFKCGMFMNYHYIFCHLSSCLNIILYRINGYKKKAGTY